ncbi:MAG: zinc-dependent metalloprotease [Gemmatimonadetes bacterium]|nr:zinc-dependent metalloprotease [Gemmatimonadota bacterium]MYG34850.1 zinc-dependent metalloprotease [Gemmatimonadota bacterium]
MTHGNPAQRRWVLPILVSTPILLAAACVGSAVMGTAAAPEPAPGEGATPAPDPGERTYVEVTEGAESDEGLFIVHRKDDDFLFEIPDSLLGRDMLLISRIAGKMDGLGGFAPAGVATNRQMVRFERQGERILLRKYSEEAVADDTLAIAASVRANYFAPILASWEIEARGTDSTTSVLDVTDFFEGDTPALSGLSPDQRRTYQVRRLDADRSFIGSVRSYPLNLNVRHTLTYDAGAPPTDLRANTVSLEMNQSLVLLPAEPMRPRYADPRVGYFTVDRINYGLDEQKAATEAFIRRWRLEPSDPEAYARGEVVDPVRPITYYVDPATPEQYVDAVKRGIENWQPAFETAGFSNAIIALEAPSRAEDPDWDPEDVRYSVARWSASETRNAQGPSTSDPRSGEIIESDIVWYHNHMRSYRNWMMVQTGAANPDARQLPLTDALMEEAMEQVITHEIGHAIGLPHNMVASSSYPVDSLRSQSFASRMGVAPTIMDYARQNYIAQPDDGLRPEDFLRRIGVYDHYSVNWGYRVLPDAGTPLDEVPTLNRWIVERAGDRMYKYLPQGGLGVTDPRAQTEDMGDDLVRANTYGVENLRRIVPNLVEWTTQPGEDYTDLAEIYGEAISQWSRYVRHIVTLVGGVHVDLKTADQEGPVFDGLPRAEQKRAMDWLAREAFTAPTWLNDPAIRERIGPNGPGLANLARLQSSVLNQLLTPRRLATLAELEAAGDEDPYPLVEFLDDLAHAVWQDLNEVSEIGPYRRALHRAHLERMEYLMTEEPAGNPFQGAAPDMSNSDIRPLVREQLRIVRLEVSRRLDRQVADRVTEAHLRDVLARVDAILDPGPA